MATARDQVPAQGYSSTVRKVLQVDENGYPTGTSQGTIIVTLASAQSVPASGVVTTPALNVDGYKDFVILATSTLATTIYLQCSDDGLVWYDLTTSAGAALTFALTANQMNAIPITGVRTPYIRIVLKNTGASAAIVTAKFVAGG